MRVTVLTTKRQLHRFLGMARFCHIWIPDFGSITKPLYEILKGGNNEPLEWARECHKAFQVIKEKLLTAPASGLPDNRKPFDFFVHERQGISLGSANSESGQHKKTYCLFFKIIRSNS